MKCQTVFVCGGGNNFSHILEAQMKGKLLQSLVQTMSSVS